MFRAGFKNLIDWKNKKERKPLIFKGARQVGKTFLLNEFGKTEFANFHYFNFEKESSAKIAFQGDLNPKTIIEELQYLKNKKIDIHNDLIIFDEIQLCPRALTSLKYFCEDAPDSFVCSAGSLLGLYSEDPSFPVGKIEYLSLYPMNFQEFIKALGEEELLNNYIKKPSEILHERIWNRYTDYLVVGGLPEAVQAFVDHQHDMGGPVFEKITAIHDDLINGYIADMAKHCGKENAMFLQRLWQISAEKIGQDHSEKFKFKGVFPGKKTYADFAGPIDWLSKAGLIYKVPIIESTRQPLSLDPKENFFKIFNFDVGILNYLKSIPYQELKKYDFSHKGFLAENFVIQELNSVAPKGFFLYSYKKGTSEIEFLFEDQGVLRPLEVKAGQNLKAKSLNLFLEENKTANAIRLSRKLLPMPLQELMDWQKQSSRRLCDLPLFLTSYIKSKS